MARQRRRHTARRRHFAAAANLYFDYTLDLWGRSWRKHKARGQVILVRCAADFVVGFQYKDDAERFHAELRERLEKFNLERNEAKRRLIEFGRYADDNRRDRGGGKPETFNFFGFTHICGKTRNGRFCVPRQAMAKRNGPSWPCQPWNCGGGCAIPSPRPAHGSTRC